MQKASIISLIAAILAAPSASLAQHGGGRGGGGGGGGGYRGGGGFGGGGGRGGGPGGGGFSGGGGGGSRGPSAPGYRATSVGPHAGPSPAHYGGPHGGPGPHNFVYGHRPAYHGGWYHGDWHGGWGHPWGYRPWGWYWGGGWGLGLGWGFGTGLALGVSVGSPWGWGYYPYYNPYWVPPVGGVTYINYGQPIVVAPPAVTAPAAAVPAPGGYTPGYAPQVPQVPPTPGLDGSTFGPPPASPPGPNTPAAPKLTSAQQQALATFDSARALFKRGDYALALAEANRAVGQVPNDTLIHEFRALCLFAQKDYQQSAAAVYAVLSIGPGWDWATVSGLYSDPAAYTEQLRALETYCNENPQAPHARFLLAYHYMLEGHNDEAATELEATVELQPKDTLAAQLLKGLRAKPGDKPVAGPALVSNTPPAAPAAPVEQAMVLGNWKADRDDGSKFELNLTKDNHFDWKFSQDGRDQALTGTYTLANNYLILSAADQNALVGQVAMEPGDKLKFKLAGGAPGDPGLTFTR